MDFQRLKNKTKVKVSQICILFIDQQGATTLDAKPSLTGFKSVGKSAPFSVASVKTGEFVLGR